MREQDFLRLLRFYLACIEAEDRRSLTKKLSALHHSLVSPWEMEEPLFHPEASEAVFEASLSSDQKVLLGGAALAGGPERLFYGYPVFLDGEGFLSPMFVAEVEVEHLGKNRFAIRPVEAGEIQLNHHVFRRQHAQPEELRAIQDELEGAYGSFTDRLRAAFEALGGPPLDFPPSPLDPYPKADSPRDRWVNRPILFKSERNAYTRHLRRELEALVEYGRLLTSLDVTAAGVVAGIAPRTSPSAAGQPFQLPLLQVLPLNPSQERAAQAALEAPLTVVTGPPGTGKSQLVVDLLASCAVAARPVLFASKNNKAVDVVRARLRALLGEEQDWTLRLGSRNVMEESRQEMESRLARMRPDAVRPAPAPELLHGLEQEIATLRRRIEQLERARLDYVKLDRERRAAEALVDPAWVERWVPGSLSPDPSRVEQLARTAEALAGKRPAGVWLKLKRALFPAALRRRLSAELAVLSAALPQEVRTDVESTAQQLRADPWVSLAEAYRRLAYLARWRALEDACGRVLAALNREEPANVLSERLENLQCRRADLACDQLRATWTGRFAARAASVQYALSQYFDLSSRVRQSGESTFPQALSHFKNAVHSLSRDLPVWIVTNLSVRNALPLEPALFDLVIIDEASQCDIPSSLPLLFRARRALIIGDPRQLRHISTLSAREEEVLARQYGVDEFLTEWSYNQRSLYALAEGAALRRGAHPFFLAEHYRSHPEIIEFSNRTFYQGRLILRTNLGALRERLKGERLGLFWHDIRGTVPWSSRSAVNEIEVRAVIDLLNKWASTGFLLREGVDFGVVTPFRLQMERLEEAVRAAPWWEQVRGRLTVGTAHRFQGDERDVMIFSPVVADGMLPRLVRWVADTEQLLNVAVTRARAALHVVGDLRACLSAGGCLGAFASAVSNGGSSQSETLVFESAAEMRMAELLEEVGLWFAPQYALGRHRLDFLVVTPFGTRYNVEVDGRGHLTDEAIQRDETRDAALLAMGLKILRVDARRIFNNEDQIREVLRRLV